MKGWKILYGDKTKKEVSDMRIKIDTKTLGSIPKLMEIMTEEYSKYFNAMWKVVKSIEIETNPRYAFTIVFSKKAILNMEKNMGKLSEETVDKMEKTMGPIQELIEKLL